MVVVAESVVVAAGAVVVSVVVVAGAVASALTAWVTLRLTVRH